jgi:flagellar biosynthesis/type III secretory pathway ATPase
MEEPIADEVRGILDGHIVLDRAIAARAHYPAIDVTSSISRVMPQVVPAEHAESARALRALLASFEQKRDLITLGAYAKGSDKRVDQSLLAMPELEKFLRQDALAQTDFAETQSRLRALAQKFPA